MSAADQSVLHNRLLRCLSGADFELLRPHLTLVDLADSQSLIEPDALIGYSWFPESGLCSLIAATPAGRQVEVGVIGRDGVVDISVAHGTNRTPLQCFVQISGSAWRVRADTLRRVADGSPSLDQLLLSYAQTIFIQVAHTALANASHPIAQRLARWLLMSDDRIEADEIYLTHERLSLMLGVRRAGVTVAIQTLEKNGLISARRGAIAIADRQRLEAFAGDGYGTPEAEYKRLIGVPVN